MLVLVVGDMDVATVDRYARKRLEALERNHCGGLRAATEALDRAHAVDRDPGIEPQLVSADTGSEIASADAGTPTAITTPAATPPAIFLLKGTSSPHGRRPFKLL